MAAHADRLPRLTLKAGRNGGCNVGQAQFHTGARVAVAVVDFGWNVIYSPPAKPLQDSIEAFGFRLADWSE